MLSAMIYPLWHWELLWQLAQPQARSLLVTASLCMILKVASLPGKSPPASASLHTNTFSFWSTTLDRSYTQPSTSHPIVERTGEVFPFSSIHSPRCHTVTPLLRKLCLNPLLGRAEWPLHVFRPETWIPVGTVMVPFPLVIFFPPAVEAETHISLALLLLPAASSSSLASEMNSVNTEALSAAVVVSL